MVRFTIAIVLAALLAVDRDDAPIRLTGGSFTHEVKRSETLTSIGARHGVSVKALIALNGLTSRNRLEVGTMLRIDNRHLARIQVDRGLSINVAQRMLYLVTRWRGRGGVPDRRRSAQLADTDRRLQRHRQRSRPDLGRSRLDSTGDAGERPAGHHARAAVA